MGAGGVPVGFRLEASRGSGPGLHGLQFYTWRLPLNGCLECSNHNTDPYVVLPHVGNSDVGQLPLSCSLFRASALADFTVAFKLRAQAQTSHSPSSFQTTAKERLAPLNGSTPEASHLFQILSVVEQKSIFGKPPSAAKEHGRLRL